MQNFCKRSLGLLCGGFLILSGVINSPTAKALDNGIYTAKCTPYYVHPVTGVVEDRGGIDSVGIGQPMTDSATYTTALIEVDPNGNTYATVRLSLMDNIENVSFKVQADGNAPFNDVSYDIMQEDLDNNTTDFRMQIPGENSYLRATFYVVPMSRDVIYYIGFSDLQPGSADFVTSVEVAQQTDAPQTEPSESGTETESTSASTSASETTTTASTDQKTTKAETTETETETTTIAVSADAEGYMPQTGGRSDSDGIGVLIYDERGNKMDIADVIGGTAEGADKDTGNNKMVVGVLAGCGGTVAILGIAYAIIRSRKKGSK
jgi:hypothetical protein